MHALNLLLKYSFGPRYLILSSHNVPFPLMERKNLIDSLNCIEFLFLMEKSCSSTLLMYPNSKHCQFSLVKRDRIIFFQ